jgi:hypothetical protein
VSFHTEHLCMRPVLEKARKFAIATEPAPNAIFEALLAGFNIWCTPEDHPEGWEELPMIAGAFSKPCEYVGTATWGWEDEHITHMLSDRDPAGRHAKAYHNRPEDVAGAVTKVGWLFSRAGIPCPPIKLSREERR